MTSKDLEEVGIDQNGQSLRELLPADQSMVEDWLAQMAKPVTLGALLPLSTIVCFTRGIYKGRLEWECPAENKPDKYSIAYPGWLWNASLRTKEWLQFSCKHCFIKLWMEFGPTCEGIVNTILGVNRWNWIGVRLRLMHHEQLLERMTAPETSKWQKRRRPFIDPKKLITQLSMLFVRIQLSSSTSWLGNSHLIELSSGRKGSST